MPVFNRRFLDVPPFPINSLFDKGIAQDQQTDSSVKPHFVALNPVMRYAVLRRKVTDAPED